MPTWRAKLVTRLGPPISLCGVTFRDWLRVLRDNQFAIDPPYLPRAASATLASLANSLQRRYEEGVYGPEVAGVRVQPPLFILGHWRTGTTHLHYLLAADRRFAYPTTYQVSYPHTFLSTEAVGSRLGNFLLPTRRPMDEVRISFRAPNEDEFALCQMTFCSPYLGFTFPRRQPYYDQFLTLRGAGEGVLARWKAALLQFLRKLTWKYGRPLVLKSPPHTCRIRLLLDLFPGARFVHIRRDPYAVFESTRHWLRASGPWFHLQRPALKGLDERVLRVYREVYDVFFEERGLLPKGHFHEVGFEELEQDPVGRVRGIYEALDLPDFGHAEPALRRYLDSLVGYKKNTFPGLPADLRARVAREWRRCFEEWGYPT
jgi:omega-hydroxy-beta-dihydromenaquinone-9 sulfotransferase